MSNSNVNVDFTSNDRELIASMQRAQLEILKIVQKLNMAAKAGRNMGEQTAAGVSTAVMQAKRFLVQMTGIGSAAAAILAIARQLRAEYDNMVERQRRHADAQLTYEAAIGRAIESFGGKLSGDQIVSQVQRIAKERGVSQTLVAQAVAGAANAASPDTEEDAIKVFESIGAATEYAPEYPAEEMQDLSTSMTLLERAVRERGLQRGTGEQITPEQALGFMLEMNRQSPAKQLGTVASQGMRTVMQLEKAGLTPQEAGAMAARTALQANDLDMRMSGTGAISLMLDLKKAFGDMFPDQSQFELWQTVANDERLRTTFLEGGKLSRGEGEKLAEFSTEKKVYQTMREAMFPGSPTYNSIMAGVQEFGGWDKSEQLYRDQLQEKLTHMPQTRLKMGMAAGTEDVAIGDQQGSETALVREELKKFMQSTGYSDLRQKLQTLDTEIETNLNGRRASDVFLEFLQEEEAELRKPRIETHWEKPYVVPKTPEEIKAAEQMKSMRERIQDIQLDTGGTYYDPESGMEMFVPKFREDAPPAAGNNEVSMRRPERQLGVDVAARPAAESGVDRLVSKMDEFLTELINNQRQPVQVEVAATRGTSARTRSPRVPTSKQLSLG